MAWFAPRTWATGEFLTAVLMNAQLRDNMLALKPVLGEYRFFTKAAADIETVIGLNWLECNGVAVSRTTYADLYALLNAMRATRGSGTAALGAELDLTATTFPLLNSDYPSTWPGAGWDSLYLAQAPFLIQIGSEKMLVTGGYSGASITVVRGREGTTVATHVQGASISLANDMPFGSGDGSTTFSLPDLHGRIPIALARTGGHADVAALGHDEGAALGSRRPRHVTGSTWTYGSYATPPHQDWPSMRRAEDGSYAGQVKFLPARLPSYFSYGSGEAGLLSSPDSAPINAPAYLTAGVWGIRFLA